MNGILETLKKWNVPIIGQSPAFLDETKKLPMYARSGANVVITGETGTGKEVFARAIHYLSVRADKPFIAINCGAIPADLLENELFGHAAGAFTSANSVSKGVVADADGGTLFLDEVEALLPAAQVSVLRFLQEKEFRALGSRKVCALQVRLVAATNMDFEAALREGRIRQDFYYRLNVLRLHLPPLRERKLDTGLLAQFFLAKFARESGRSDLSISQVALAKLTAHDWPGNVRELENVIKRAIACSQETSIESHDIIIQHATKLCTAKGSFKVQKAACIVEFETAFIRDVLNDSQGNITQAAKAASMDRRELHRMMKKHHVPSQQSGPHAGQMKALCPNASSNIQRQVR